MAWTGVITNAGRDMLSVFAQGGHTMSIDRAVVGSGTTPTGSMRNATSLAAQKDTAAITGRGSTDGNTQIRVQVSASNGGGYQAREVGLYAHIDSSASQLMALYQDENGVSVPDVSVNPDYEFGLFISIAISNTDALAVNVDSSANVSVGELNARIAEINTALAGKVSNSTHNTDMAKKVDKTTYDTDMAKKVDKGGDTMTGTLTSIAGFRVNRADGYGGLAVQNNGNAAFSFFGDSVTHRAQVEVYTLDNSGKGDRYLFPSAEQSLSEDKWYQVLTNKNAVSVAQGGTGAANKADARTNLGINIQHGTKSVGTSAVTVTFSKEFPSAPNVVATGSLNGNVWVTNITKSGFTVQSSVASNSVKWQAILMS